MLQEETLAKKVHDIWSSWMSYVFSSSTQMPDGTMAIPKGLVERWKRQINTSYEELPEHEKLSDRKIAKDILSLGLDSYEKE